MTDWKEVAARIATSREVAIAVYDALRFARDEFVDANGLPFSDEESAHLQEIIDALEPLTTE